MSYIVFIRPILNVDELTTTSITFTAGGSVSGLNGQGLVLKNDNGDLIPINADGTFTFPKPLSDNTSYNISVANQPVGSICSVSNASGTITAGNVNNITVTCVPVPTYSVGGSVSGLKGSGLVLQNNGGDDLAIGADGSYTFSTPVNDQSSFKVTILSQPTESFCDVNSGAGTVSGANVTNVMINCDAWLTPTLIETNSGNAWFPDITVIPNGDAFAVWKQEASGTGRHDIWANRYTSGVGWGSATLIETNNIGDAANPKITSDANGNVFAVWEQSDGTHYSIWANRYVAGAGWDTAMPIETSNLGDAANPQIAADVNGNAFAVWEQSDGTRYNIWANRYTAGAGWGTATLIETSDLGDAKNAQIAVDASGNAFAIWEQSDGTRSNIWTNRYTVGTGWDVATLIETDNTGPARDPQIAFDASGNAIAIWEQYDGAHYNIWTNRYTVGTGWDVATLIETNNTGDAWYPQIALDSNGNAIAVWYQFGTTHTDIWTNRYTAGAGWGTAALLETNDAGDAWDPQIALDSNGNAIAVWTQSDGLHNKIWANRYIAGTGWRTALPIENTSGDAWGPYVGIDANGNALTVWYQYDGFAQTSIWVNRFKNQ